ncbi:MAG: GAF domain-containing protein [Fibrobacterota bacterium]
MIESELYIPHDTLNSWQEILDLLVKVLEIPAALIMRLKPPHIEVFLSEGDAENPYKPGDREIFDGSGLYCERVIKSEKSLHVPNALKDKKWDKNPDIKLGMIAYLGFPLFFPGGKPFGTICVLDRKENKFSKESKLLINKFSQIVEDNLALNYMNNTLGDENRELKDYIDEIRILRRVLPICSVCKKIRTGLGNWASVENYFNESTGTEFSHTFCPECAEKWSAS